MKEIVHTDKAPAAIGPYSQAVKVGNMVYTAGQIALHPDTGDLKNSDIEEETIRALENLKAILEKAGSDFTKIVKATIYITDMNNFAKINEIYSRYLQKEYYPAREVVQVAALPKNANIEISAIAFV